MHLFFYKVPLKLLVCKRQKRIAGNSLIYVIPVTATKQCYWSTEKWQNQFFFCYHPCGKLF